jgi:hypothetical protein
MSSSHVDVEAPRWLQGRPYRRFRDVAHDNFPARMFPEERKPWDNA